MHALHHIQYNQQNPPLNVHIEYINSDNVIHELAFS